MHMHGGELFESVCVQDRRQLLKDWVQHQGDAAAIEAVIVIKKKAKSKMGTAREHLTVQEMVSRGIPREKIDAVVARGGTPDPDCPNIVSLYRYWIQTSRVLKDSEEIEQEASMKIQGEVSASGLGALMSGPTGPMERASLPAGGMEQIMQSLQQGQQLALTGLYLVFDCRHICEICMAKKT